MRDVKEAQGLRVGKWLCFADPVEANALLMVVVENLNGVAVEDADHLTSEITSPAVGREKENTKGWKKPLYGS